MVRRKITSLQTHWRLLIMGEFTREQAPSHFSEHLIKANVVS